MNTADRTKVCRVLRLVAEEYYSGETRNMAHFTTLHRNGICYAAAYAGGGHDPVMYVNLGDAFELLGMDRCDPITDEEHGAIGDWTVRPLFCLLMADALEQLE